MKIDILTLFPDMFEGPFSESIIHRAVNKKKVSINIHNIRDYADPPHKQVDDYQFGGGAGMLLKIEPLSHAIEALQNSENGNHVSKLILMSPQGERFSQHRARELSSEESILILCGHYKGFDERIRIKYHPEEISIGDYVLSGGELCAMVMLDAVIRLIPGVVSDAESIETDSFQEKLLDYPHYTRPRIYENMSVPDILLSGNHLRIEKWRRRKSIEKTLKLRPDLLSKQKLNNADKKLLENNNL